MVSNLVEKTQLEKPFLHDPWIRGMNHTDLSRVVAIERENYDYPWGGAIFRDCLRVGYYCRVHTLEDHVVGYGILSVAAGEAHIMNICIAQDFHRRGYGQKMLNHLLLLAGKSNVTITYLEVRPTNKGAISLYYANGFEQIGVRKKYYAAKHGREDALVLARHFT